jgi:Lrp/AsnC family leucine-responsive transcriptional regulator
MYCIFEATSKYDPYLGKSRKVTRYLGYITKEGVIVPARHRKLDEGAMSELIELRREVKDLREKVPVGRQEEAAPEEKDTIDEHDKAILTALSMNSRIPYRTLSKISGIKVKSVPYRIKRLEKEFEIKYTLEINLTSLGFSRYFILVKFLESVPEITDEVRKSLEKNPRVQLVLLTEGTYDLIIYCVAESTAILKSILDSIRDNKHINSTPADWYVTPVTENYGMVPLRDNFFDILKERVWHRTKEKPRPVGLEFMQREYAVLRELNADSTISLSSIDKRYYLPTGSAKNAYENLLSGENPIIKRPTILMCNTHYLYIGIVTIKIRNRGAFVKSKIARLNYIINEQRSITNRFTYICETEAPNGSTHIFPILEEEDMEKTRAWFIENVQGIELQSSVVTQILIGNLAHRRFDNLYSLPYKELLRIKNIVPKDNVDYISLHPKHI